MAPPNDNFANAIALNPAGGNGWFNNIGSSAEPGEPASKGHTVWFSLAVAPIDPSHYGQYFFFDTREPDSIPSNVLTTDDIAWCSNESPIMIILAQPDAGIQTGSKVSISGIQSVTAANGTWTVTKIDDSTYTLNGSAGNLPALFIAPPTPPGLLIPGNININDRPLVKNGSDISTVDSITIDDGQYSVLIPLVNASTRSIMTNAQAVSWYQQTGQHLGKFDNDTDADNYANQLHLQQAAIYSQNGSLSYFVAYLNTTVQVFTGGSVSSLTESPYILAGNTQYGRNPLSVGSYVIVQSGTSDFTYYIRVDGVPEGWFFFQWGLSNGLPFLGKCGNCTQTIGISSTCIGTFQGPDLTTGDIKQASGSVEIFAVKRQTITAPAGTYMLRYCGGYYEVLSNQPPRYGFITIDAGNVEPFFFKDNVAAGFKLSPFGDNSPITLPGDCDFGSSLNTFQYTEEYFDGTQWNLNPTVNYLGGGFGDGNSHLPGLVAYVTNPPNATASGTGTGVTYYASSFIITSVQNCNSFLFTHSGGQINWMVSMPLGDFTVGTVPAPPQYDVDITPYIGTDLEPGGFIPVIKTGPAGPPSYELMRINPRLQLVSASMLFDNSGDTVTPNGQKNVILTVVIANPDLFAWNNVTCTAAGFFTVQDPNYWPGEPTRITFPAQTNSNYQKMFSMIAGGNIGSFALSFTDPVGDTFTPIQPISFTPLFGNLTGGITSQGREFTVNGVNCFVFSFNIKNIGNAPTINGVVTISATANGQAIQVAGVNGANQVQPWGPSFTYSPATAWTDPINPTGYGLGWQPGQIVNGIIVYIPAIKGQAQTVEVNFAVKDGANAFPPSQITVQIPAGT